MTTTTVKKPRYFYGWNIVGATFLAQTASAQQNPSIFGFFFKPLQQEFGWSRSAIAAVQSIAQLSGALVTPIVGPLIDRYGARVLMPIGAVIVGLALLGATQINNIWQFYLSRGVVAAIGLTLIGGLVSSVIISNWFIRKSGRAIAISTMGNTLGAIIFSAVTVFIIAAYGWRTMFGIFAGTAWLFVIIPSSIIIRRRPEDMGLYPDGINPDIAQAGSPQEARKELRTSEPTLTSEPIWSLREVLLSVSFWLLTATSAIDSLSFQALNVSLVPYIQDLGYGAVTVALVVTSRLIIKLIATPAVGFAAEHADKAAVRAVPFLIESLGVLLLLLAQEPVLLWLGIAIYTVGVAGVQVTQPVVWANYFGRLSLGRVRSLSQVVSLGFAAIGPIAMNLAFDIIGSYRPALVVNVGLFVVAASLISIAQHPKARH